MDDEFEPLLGRPQVAWYNLVGDFLNMLKAFIGTNYQALPFAFHNSGLALGIIGVFAIATVTDHCIGLLIQSKLQMISDVCEEERMKGTSEHDIHMLQKRLEATVGYGDVAKRAYGKWCYQLTQFLVWFTQLATCVAYFIFIGNTIAEIFPLGVVQLCLRNATIYNGTLPDEDVSSTFNDSWPCVTDNSRNSSSYNSIVAYDLFNGTNMTTSLPPGVTTKSPSIIPNVPTAPDLRLIILFPLPFFIFTSLIRKMRYLSPFSTIASLALFVGAFCVMIYILLDFHVNPEYKLFKFATFPLFVGQIISAYEGIGCLVPIHSSMEGNRHLFPVFLHANIYIVFVILCLFGSLGYLHYGDNVSQLLVENIRQHSLKSTFVDVTLIISVLFTYPLQCFPAIEITETYLLGPGRICGPPGEPRLEYDEIGGNQSVQSPEEERGLLHDTASVELQASQVSVIVPPVVPAYRRNIVRVILTLGVVGFSILMRNSYAYLNVFSGAVGCSALALILPCCIHIKVCKPSKVIRAKNYIIIGLAILASIGAVIQVMYKLVKGEAGEGGKT